MSLRRSFFSSVLMTTFLISTISLSSMSALAACPINGGTGPRQDLLTTLLSQLAACPTHVADFKKALQADGVTATPSMVANRGRHNPGFGSFSFFEVAEGNSKALGLRVGPGEFYFGHFTTADSNFVELDQEPVRGKLLIELIAWDYNKQLFNFYELVGTLSGPHWFYRGDSADALADNQLLHLQQDPAHPQFGSRMRCSGCHTSGGPIMKELAMPHNDWWVNDRPLPFAPLQPGPTIQPWLATVADAKDFAEHVKAGMTNLAESEKYQKVLGALSLQEQLRPLFCTTEINLVSDSKDLALVLATGESIKVASEVYVNPMLAPQTTWDLQSKAYIDTLIAKNFQFPETTAADADHAWLAPVKGEADQVAIRHLITSGLIDEEFAVDVLAVDLEHPLFSAERCGLLPLVPSAFSESWRDTFTTNLAHAQTNPATLLLDHFQNESKTKDYHRRVAAGYADQMRLKFADLANTGNLFEELHVLRMSVFANEISKNPRGQILEPGFRVIFPLPNP